MARSAALLVRTCVFSWSAFACSTHIWIHKSPRVAPKPSNRQDVRATAPRSSRQSPSSSENPASTPLSKTASPCLPHDRLPKRGAFDEGKAFARLDESSEEKCNVKQWLETPSHVDVDERDRRLPHRKIATRKSWTRRTKRVSTWTRWAFQGCHVCGAFPIVRAHSRVQHDTKSTTKLLLNHDERYNRASTNEGSLSLLAPILLFLFILLDVDGVIHTVRNCKKIQFPFLVERFNSPTQRGEVTRVHPLACEVRKKRN